MKSLSTCVLFVVAIGFGLTNAQAPNGNPIERLDPALDAILAPNARLELLGEHFGMIEGPVWVQEGQNGYLLFSDMAANVIYKRTFDGQVSVFLENSGYTGNDILNVGAQSTGGRLHILLIGSDGLTLDPQGRLVIAAMVDRTVVRLEKDGKRTVLADRYEGKRFSGPNDLVVKSNGAVYFADSTAGLRGRDKSPARELPFNGVFLVKEGKVQLLAKDIGTGIALSTDERSLFLGGGKSIMRYDIQADDTIANGRMFSNVGAGAIKVDQKGNLYTQAEGTGPAVGIISAEGKHIGTIHIPKIVGVYNVTNVGFGDPDGKGLYITARTHLFRIRVNIPGVRPGPKQ